MGNLETLRRGREAFARRGWADAYRELAAADADSPLDPQDLIEWAMAAYLTGQDAGSVEILARAHQECVARGDTARAVRCAFWVGFQSINKGDMAQAGGWFARGRRLLEEDPVDCVERGYLMIPVALQSVYGGDAAAGFEIFAVAGEIGDRFNDPDLRTLSCLGRGQALINMGDARAGVPLLDEAMVAVSTGEVSAVVTGLVYCAVITACHQLFDLGRAREWTEVLSQWCAAQPDLVPYRGQCLVHRAEIMQLHGAWSDAMEEAVRAREQLMRAPDEGAVGMAYYEMAELHRLRGDFEEAQDSYRNANQHGFSPQPGLARLRLAQGQLDDAQAAIRRVFDEANDPPSRAKFLPAYVDIMLAVNDPVAARTGADDLLTIADQLDAPYLQALAAHARGSVLLAEGDARAALAQLRTAWSAWRKLEAPYEAARTRLLIGLACRALHDNDTGNMELDAARRTFQELGAIPDLAAADELLGVKPSSAFDGLTGREVEILALVATGKTNREIASDLVISEKTVARHVSNTFTKLEVTSRSAATAYAFKHDLA